MIGFGCLTSFTHGSAVGQCGNWSISATPIAGSTCTANGEFSVTVSGPDAPNVSAIQYGVPMTANGFSVPLNNASIFTNIPGGTYTVSAVGSCNGALVGKNTTVTIPGSYVPPTMAAFPIRGSLSCGKYGIIRVHVSKGRPPFNVNILSAPPTYTGPTTFNTQDSVLLLRNLPAGAYSVQVWDGCGSGTTPVSATISSVGLSNPLPLNFYSPSASNCNTLNVARPTFSSSNLSLYAYEGDTLFKVSAQVGNGLSGPTPFVSMYWGALSLPLTGSATIKDCYGQNITYTIKPPCGPNFSASQTIPYPYVSVTTDQQCNAGFRAMLAFKGAVCLPITYTVQNTATQMVYGPYTTTTAADTTPSLPLGSYTVSYTTGDGWNGAGAFSAAPIAGNPYSVTVEGGSRGLHNYIEGFRFSTSGPNNGQRTVELFSGPAGYSFSGIWGGTQQFWASGNGTPWAPGSQLFPAGAYVWKITDNCGTYFLPVTVGPQHLYQFTAGVAQQKRTCAGVWVWPSGSAAHNGSPVAVKFSVLHNGWQYLPPGTTIWPVYNPGDSFLITQPGEYRILPHTGTAWAYQFSPPNAYPNPYTQTFGFTPALDPVRVNRNATQGFLCKGAVPGQGKIFAQGASGLPFAGPHYQYQLAAAGNGLTGPYIAANTNGVFSNFGGNAGFTYDVKITDSCGAFAVQPVTILDLQTARIIAASAYTACAGGSVQLFASYLPNANYTWTGPAGFSSNQQNPIIASFGPANVGVYTVTVSTPECGQPVTDSTAVTVAPTPVPPVVSLSCGPPVELTITNPQPGISYQWRLGRLIPYGVGYIVNYQPSDYGFTKEVSAFFPTSYTAIAIDSTTGCLSASDSFFFSGQPVVPFIATVTSPHLQVCAGESTTLIAQTPNGAPAFTYQWFKDGVLIPGATGPTHTTALPGAYTVRVYAGPCQLDTSAAVIVTVVQPPVATLTATPQHICAGDTSWLQAATGAGYSYTWMHNGNTIPGATGATFGATQSGTYSVIISNGGCIAVSPAVSITVAPAPVVSIAPSSEQEICPGGSVTFSTPANLLYTYSWRKNGVLIPGAVTSTFTATASGIYTVVVSTPACPGVSSVPVRVRVLPAGVSLPADTVVCAAGTFSIPLSVDSGFSSIMWSGGQTGRSIVATTSGVYWVRATNACGTFSDTMRVAALADFTPAMPVDTTICNAANAAVLSVPSLLQDIQWSTGATAAAITVTAPGVYWVRGESPCGTMRDTIRVAFCAPIVHAIQLENDTLCEGDCIRITAHVANYPQSYLWTMSGTSPRTSTSPSPGVLCYDSAGVYSVKVVVRNPGGADSATAQVVVLKKPHPRFKDTAITVRYGVPIALPACASAAVVDWYKDGELVCAGCPSLPIESRYFLSDYQCVLRNGGCLDSCGYRVRVVDIPNELWLPTAFSPNGDGRNDVFRIITDNPNILVRSLAIYNRWGQRVFHAQMSNVGWDGNIAGVPAETGVYFWMLDYEVLGTKETHFRKGDVTLLR